MDVSRPCSHQAHTDRDLAIDAQLGELPMQCAARGAGLVADLQIPAATQPFDELEHGFRAVENLPRLRIFSRPSAMAAAMVSA